MSVHVYTNTITRLPYGYQLKLEVISYTISGPAATTTTIMTNAPHIINIGRITTSYDAPLGEVRLGDLTFSVKDYNGEVSTNWTPYERDYIEVRLWISYNTGTDWECLFFGFVRIEQTRRTDKHISNPHNMIWEFSAYHIYDSLKNKDAIVFFGTLPTQPAYFLKEYHTTEDGTPVHVNTINEAHFTTIYNIIVFILSQIMQTPNWNGTINNITIDYSEVQCLGFNENTNTGYTIDELCLWNNAPYMLHPELPTLGFFSPHGGLGSMWGMKSYAKVLSSICSSLNVIPLPILVDTGGVISLVMKLRPRYNYTPIPVTTAPSPLIGRSLSAIQTVDGGQITIQGHPMPEEYTRTGVNKGNQYSVNILYATSPDIGVDPYLWGDSVWQGDFDGNMKQNVNASTQQLFAWDNTLNSIVQIHKFKHITQQSYHETAGIGYYGVAESLKELLFDPYQYSLFIRPRMQYIATFKDLKGDTIQDVELGKSMVFDTKTCVITSITRDVVKNVMELILTVL